MIRLGVAVLLVFLSAAYGSKDKRGQLLFGLRTERSLVCSGRYTFSHTVEWTLNGTSIVAKRGYRMNERTLTIQSSGAGAGGIYRCTITNNNQVTSVDTFQIQVVAPVTFNKCGGLYCTEEIDVSSLSPHVKSALFLSSSLSYSQGVRLAGQESTNEAQWRVSKSSDVNLKRYCLDVDSSVCSLASCNEDGACRTSALLNRAALRTTNGRLNKSITLDVNRLERDLVGRKNSVTVLLQVNLPYRVNVLGTTENWVTVKAFRLYNFPASIRVSSQNCTEKNDVCKFIANEGDTLTVCNDIEVKGGGNPIMLSSWMVTMNSQSFNASLCTTEDSNDCSMSSVGNMSVHSRWGRCLVMNNVTEKQHGLRLKYKLTALPQMKVTGLLESREMVIHVMAAPSPSPSAQPHSEELFYITLASLAGGGDIVILILSILSVASLCTCCCKLKSSERKRRRIEQNHQYDHLPPRTPPQVPPRPFIRLPTPPLHHSYITLVPEQESYNVSVPGDPHEGHPVQDVNQPDQPGPQPQLGAGPYPRLMSLTVSVPNRLTRYASAPPEAPVGLVESQQIPVLSVSATSDDTSIPGGSIGRRDSVSTTNSQFLQVPLREPST